MQIDWAILGILFLLSANFLSLTWVTDFNPKRHRVGGIFTFAFTHTLFLWIGWGISGLIMPLFKEVYISIPGVLLLFVGIKRVIAYFTTKRTLFHFQINRPVDALAIAVATSMDAILIGMALLFFNEKVYFSLLLLFLLTLTLSIIGYFLSRKGGNLEASLLLRLFSGIGLIIMSFLYF